MVKSLNITSQTRPDASPVGLRLVGLLPCAVWASKAPKPSSAALQQVRAAPYTIPSSSVGIQQHINRSIDPNCRCTTTTTSVTPTGITLQQQLSQPPPQPSAILPIQPTAVALNPTQVTPVLTAPVPTAAVTAQTAAGIIVPPAQPIAPVAPVPQPVAATSTNPMLLVPFAVPGFVPIQPQQTPSSNGTGNVNAKVSENKNFLFSFFFGFLFNTFYDLIMWRSL